MVLESDTAILTDHWAYNKIQVTLLPLLTDAIIALPTKFKKPRKRDLNFPLIHSLFNLYANKLV